MYHEYPYSTYYNDIDEICRVCRDLGLRLEVKNDYLRLIDKKGNVISNVQISYAEKARYDDEGHFISSYIINIGADAHKLVINHGNGSVSTVTVPYAEEAQTALDCIVELRGHEDGIFYRFGNGSNGNLIPGYSEKAGYSDKGKDIDTFATTLVVDGDYIGLKDNYGTFLSRIIPALAIAAREDDAGNVITSNYGAALVNGVNTIKLISTDNQVISELTVPYAEKATYDEEGNDIDSFYGHSLASVNGSIQLKDAHGNVLSTAEVHDLSGITQIQVIGDQVVFTNGEGTSVSITVPYAVKCLKDSLNNTIVNTYIASVQNDPQTGALNFYDATGALVCTLTPTVTQASQDDYGNTIADYIKTIVADNQSDYILATHGDGTVDSITINYANVAWKDTNGNVIKNTYTKRIEFMEDPTDHHMKLVGYNGDTPEAEIWRTDMLVDLQTLPFGAELSLNGQQLSLIDRQGTTLSSVDLSSATLGIENLITKIPSTYDNFDTEHRYTYDRLASYALYDQKPDLPGETVQPIAGPGDSVSLVAGNLYYLEVCGFEIDASSYRDLRSNGRMYFDENRQYLDLLGGSYTQHDYNFNVDMTYKTPTFNNILSSSVIESYPQFLNVLGGFIVPVAYIDPGEVTDYIQFRLVLEFTPYSNITINNISNISNFSIYTDFQQFNHFTSWIDPI